MTEGRYPPDDMFKADFERGRPPHKPTLLERLGETRDAVVYKLTVKPRRIPRTGSAAPSAPAQEAADLVSHSDGETPPKDAVIGAARLRPTELRAELSDSETPLDSPSDERADGAAEVEQAPAEVEQAPAEVEQAPAEVLEPPTPLTRRIAGAGMFRPPPPPLSAPRAPEVLPSREADTATFPPSPGDVRANPPDSAADLDRTGAASTLAPSDSPKPALAPKEVGADKGAAVPRDEALNQAHLEWPSAEDSSLFEYQSATELRMPETLWDRARSLLRSVVALSRAEEYGSELPPSDVEDDPSEEITPGPQSSLRPARRWTRSWRSPETPQDQLGVDAPSGATEAASNAKAPTVETPGGGRAEAVASGAVGQAGEALDDAESTLEIPLTRHGAFTQQFRHRGAGTRDRASSVAPSEVPTPPVPDAPAVNGPEATMLEDRRASDKFVPAPDPSDARGSGDIGDDVAVARGKSVSDAVQGALSKSLGSVKASAASAISSYTRKAPAARPIQDASETPSPDPGIPIGAAAAEVSAFFASPEEIPSVSEAPEVTRSAPKSTPEPKYVPRHSRSRIVENSVALTAETASEYRESSGAKAVEPPRSRARHAKTSRPPSFRPARPEGPPPRHSRSAIAGAISLGLVLVIAVGIAKLSNSPSIRTSSTSLTVTTPPTTQAPTTTPTTRVSGVDAAPTTLPQPKTIVVATTVARRTKTTAAPTTTSTVPPLANAAYAQITVRVANGTTVTGAAGRITSKLQAMGFNVVVPIDATVSDLSTTTIYYYTGFSVAGQGVAEILGLPASAAKPLTASAPLPDIYPSDVNVVLGTDVAG